MLFKINQISLLFQVTIRIDIQTVLHATVSTYNAMQNINMKQTKMFINYNGSEELHFETHSYLIKDNCNHFFFKEYYHYYKN